MLSPHNPRHKHQHPTPKDREAMYLCSGVQYVQRTERHLQNFIG
ncbi:hypothetical protein BH24BAC1_BH24BAC1_39660 [soil metagenome]